MSSRTHQQATATVIFNEHVYVYFRWKGWIAEQNHRHWRAFFMRDFARQEKFTAQEQKQQIAELYRTENKNDEK